MEYRFTLKFKLPKQDVSLDELVERLGARGCNDAIVGIGRPGRIVLAFVRESDREEAALQSALSDIEAAIPGARLLATDAD